MKKLFLCCLFLLFYCFFAFPVFAQEGWQIHDFHSDIVVLNSGVVTITETIAVDFNNLSKHGIYRDIPYVYQNKDKSKYYTEVTFGSILQDGYKAKHQISTNGSYYEIKIGDPDTTISGKHTYTISYSVKGILRGFSDHDELYWNVTGDDWGVPIMQAATTISLPKEGILSVSCYQGPSGSKDLCSGENTQTQATFSSSKQLSANEGMTVAVLYKKGSVPLLTVSRQKSFTEKLFSPAPIAVFVLFSLGSFLFLFSKWRNGGRDMGNVSSTVVVEYTAPEKLRPAEIGVLTDQKADTLDVTATIIDLTGRGYMTITEIPKKWMFGKTDYTLDRLKKKISDLLPYESLLLDRLFEDGDSVVVSALKNKFYQDLAAVKKALYQDVVERGLFSGNPESIRTKYMAVGGICIFLGVMLFLSVSYIGMALEWIDFSIILAIGGGLFISAIWFFVFSRFMPKRTAYGHELYQRAKGYQLFISEAEKYRQRFFEKKNLFNEVMPYAIVFGLTQKFADAMKEIGLNNPQVVGYYGSRPFTSGAFVSSVDDFSSSMSSAIASTPSSSGGGGGGSSGGFGGGGGGSW